MARLPSEVRIAVNVMRARLTIVGFNIAVVSFQLNAEKRIPGAVELPGLGVAVHLTTDIALLLGLALSVVAMICFIVSGALDQQGTCDHWTLLAGDLLMYLGLAQAVSGFFQPYVAVLDAIGPAPAEASVRLTAAYIALLGFGGAAWLAATYLGPVISLLRSPFGRAPTVLLAFAYLLLLLALAYVGAETRKYEAASAGSEVRSITLLGEFFQPYRW